VEGWQWGCETMKSQFVVPKSPGRGGRRPKELVLAQSTGISDRPLIDKCATLAHTPQRWRVGDCQPPAVANSSCCLGVWSLLFSVEGWLMKSLKYCLGVMTALSITFAGSLATANGNLLINPGFEDPITMDGPPFVGSWEGFVSGAAATSANSSTMPLTGAQSLELTINATVNQFAGAFQDVPGLTAGQDGTFSGWHKQVSGDSGGIEIRIEWRDSVGDVEISRTPNFVPSPGASYEEFSLTAAVPSGADTARVVYAIQSFGGALNQQVFVDDTSFTIIPEPASIVLFGVAGMTLLTRRHRGL
jgi:hypothetical protein